MTKCQEKSVLPKKLITVFDGSDITKFKIFMLNFERIIETKCDNSADKLIYLDQYTSGKAQKLVRSCNHYDADIGYGKAKKLLLSEYGNEFKVAHAYIEKLDNWPVIKNEDAEALQELSIYLLDCYHYLENMSLCNQLQSPKEIMNVVRKLPYRFRERWRRRTHAVLSKDENVCFKHLVDFVQQEVSVLKQPLFGSISDEVVSNRKCTSYSKNRTVLSTSTDSAPKPTCQETI